MVRDQPIRWRVGAGGGRGIRTPERVSPLTVFKTCVANILCRRQVPTPLIQYALASLAVTLGVGLDASILARSCTSHAHLAVKQWPRHFDGFRLGMHASTSLTSRFSETRSLTHGW